VEAGGTMASDEDGEGIGDECGKSCVKGGEII
jgi:hypothetical protein